MNNFNDIIWIFLYVMTFFAVLWWYTVIPRLTKIIRSGITFVSRNVMLSGVLLLAVSNVNNPVGLVGLPYVMWSAHFFVTHIQTEKISSWNGPSVRVCCFMLARASTKTFVSRVRKTAKKSSLAEKFVSGVTRQPRYHCTLVIQWKQESHSMPFYRRCSCVLFRSLCNLLASTLPGSVCGVAVRHSSPNLNPWLGTYAAAYHVLHWSHHMLVIVSLQESNERPSDLQHSALTTVLSRSARRLTV